ncbi:NAD/NADP octopine/nopaline dehydrogenase family protein [Bacillus tianshenii]|nr:NAD/NADP octopine/nopaline dehydrogenase family protein [Bacillus tianshenii]
MNYTNITIIGGGSGGYAAAGDLMIKGYQVTVFEHPEYHENIFPLIKSRNLKLTGEISGLIPSPKVEVNIKKAVLSADVILIITHAKLHQEIAEMIASYIRSEQCIVILPGYTGGTLCFEKVFKENNVQPGYILAETNTLPYACRKINGEAAVHVKLYVKKLYASAFPSTQNDRFIKLFKQLYPNTCLTNNVLETGFNNGNPVLNVAPCIFNAGRIEYADGEYYHFQEGVTPRVSDVMAMLDEERMAIGQAIGLDILPYLERVIDTGYVKQNNNWYDTIHSSDHLTAKGPENLTHRYITEDVPYGFVPWIEIAEKFNVSANLMRSFSNLASALIGENYFNSGRKLTDMGINHLSAQEIKQYVEKGY